MFYWCSKTCRKHSKEIASKTIKVDDNDLGYLNYHFNSNSQQALARKKERAKLKPWAARNKKARANPNHLAVCKQLLWYYSYY